MRSSARRQPRIVTTSALTASLVVVMVTASVAGATTASSPKKWVSTMCETFVKWEQAAKTGDSKLEKVLGQLQKSGNTSLGPLRGELVKFLGDFATASHQARAQIAAAGAPSVKNGKQIQATVVNALGTAATFLDRARAAAAAFPIDNAKAFISKTDALAKSITKTFTSVGNSLSALRKYKATELEAAAKADPACKKLTG